MLLVRPALILNHQQKAACLLVLYNILSNGDNYDSTISNEVMVDDDIITSSSSDFEFQSDLGEEIWDGTDDDNDAANVDMNQVDDHVENEKNIFTFSN